MGGIYNIEDVLHGGDLRVITAARHWISSAGAGKNRRLSLVCVGKSALAVTNALELSYQGASIRVTEVLIGCVYGKE